jgi:predicted CxxxxCH...CXXCH cytochrome family protein
MNGTPDVELYNASAPIETLKAKNPASAVYDTVDKTCGNVYCHSGYTVTSSSVGQPLTYPENPIPPGYLLNNNYIMDPTCSNLTYAPYTVTIARDYRTTPAWGTTGTFTTCTECHAFPLTTYYPAVSAMAGDTHQWVDENGYNWGHAYNMLGIGGIPCATCHYGSVDHSGGGSYPHAQTTNPPTYWAGNIVAYNPAPIKNRSSHLNGRPDVAFDTVNGYRYYSPPVYDDQFDLTAATYDAPTQTCSNVSCHYNSPNITVRQQSPKWGSPFGPYSVSGAPVQCDLCHRFGYLRSVCVPAP